MHFDFVHSLFRYITACQQLSPPLFPCSPISFFLSPALSVDLLSDFLYVRVRVLAPIRAFPKSFFPLCWLAQRLSHPLVLGNVGTAAAHIASAPEKKKYVCSVYVCMSVAQVSNLRPARSAAQPEI